MEAPKKKNEKLNAKLALPHQFLNGAAPVKAKKVILTPGMPPNFSTKKVTPKPKSAWQTAVNMWT